MLKNLPVSVEVDDYHEFGYLEDILKKIDRNFKVVEIGCAFKRYIGIIYYKKQDAKFKRLKKEIEKEINDYYADE